jgi:hypothetical protein
MDIKTTPSSLSFKAFIIYVIPGFILLIDILWWADEILTKIKIPSNLFYLFSSPKFIIFLIFIFSIVSGFLIETLRVFIVPKITPWMNRIIPKQIYNDPNNMYERYFDRIFLGGNFSYNLVIPFFINPLFPVILGNFWGFVLNLILALLLFNIGIQMEDKFYRFLDQLKD